MKLILIIVGSLVLLGLGGGGYYLVNKNSSEEVTPPVSADIQPAIQTTPSATPSPTPQTTPKPLTKTETITAKAFANKILGYLQSKDYGKLWDLFTPEGQKMITRGEYVKKLVEAIGNYNISSYEVKEIIEENDGASFQWILRYSNNPYNPEETGLFHITKRNGKWFFLNEAESQVIIEKHIGDTIELATLKFKINSAEERQVISNKYGESASAKENAKFVVVDMSITNTTNQGYLFPNDGSFTLVDNTGRQFGIYDNAIGHIDNYLNVRNLAPGVTERGYVVYEIAADASSYGIAIGKAGTNDIYKVILK